jgi:tight adherence protein C
MTPDLLLAAAGVFVAVALVTGSLLFLVVNRSPERRRLEQLVGHAGESALGTGPIALDVPDPTLQKLSKLIPKSPKEMGRIRRRLQRAGYHSGSATALYALAELGLPIAFGGAALMVFGARRGWIIAIIAALVGYMLPAVFVGRKLRARKKQIENGLPDALDLLIVCVEAGSALDQAILKASDELEISYPTLAAELRHINMEIRAGKPRTEAFKNFYERTKVDDVRGLVSMLIQTDKFGTSVSQALRTHAEVARTKRRQRAEEAAAKLGVKLVFPLVFCLFPALYVVTLGPAIIQFVRVFFGQVMQR